MKRALLAILLSLLLPASLATAEAVEKWQVHVVVKGDTLWGISRKYDVQVKDIAKRNDIKDVNKIYPGQALDIKPLIEEAPDKPPILDNGEAKKPGVNYWGKKNVDPYIPFSERKDGYNLEFLKKSVDLFKRMPAEVKGIFKKMIDKGEWQKRPGVLKIGDKRVEMHTGSGILQNVVVAKDPTSEINSWATDSMVAYWNNELWVLDIPFVCGNMMWGKLGPLLGKKPAKKEETQKEPEVSTAPEKPEEDTGFVLPPVPYQPQPGIRELQERSIFDVIAGGGIYEGQDERDHDGYYKWIKGRIRPITFYMDKKEIQLGVMGFYGEGSGDDNDWEYDWEKWYVGPTVKIFAQKSDYDIDLGYGRLENSGGVGQYRSEQTDDIFVLSAHANFYNFWGNHKEWWRKFEANLEVTIPLDVSRSDTWRGQPVDSEEFDNQVVEVSFRQSIRDFYPDKDIRITPNLELGLGHEYGNDASFIKFGPSVTFAYEEQDILIFAFLNWKESFGGEDQLHWASLTLDGGRLYEAVRADQYDHPEKSADQSI